MVGYLSRCKTKIPGLLRGSFMAELKCFLRLKKSDPAFAGLPELTDRIVRSDLEPDQEFSPEFRDGVVVDTSVNVLKGNVGTLGERITEVQA